MEKSNSIYLVYRKITYYLYYVSVFEKYAYVKTHTKEWKVMQIVIIAYDSVTEEIYFLPLLSQASWIIFQIQYALIIK